MTVELTSIWDGTTVRLQLDGPVPAGARLAFDSLVALTPNLHQVGYYHELDPARLSDLSVSHPPRHSNDGPRGAFLILADGTAHQVVTVPMRSTVHGSPRLRQAQPPGSLEFEGEPVFAFRGLMVDLARQWFEPDVLLRLLDAAAERRLTHLHLHLTDDEAWRLPVPRYPALGEIGGTRGHGLPLPPTLGSGPAPYGRCYTADEIATWVSRADQLGIVLVPEVDLPAHNHAALTALPHLRDPDDTSAAVSVQWFTDNVIVPGHPATQPFLEAVVDALAELFPNSPHLHIGGDEVPHGAWRGSSIVAALQAEHGLATARSVEAWFHRHLADLIRERTGRRVAAWQEAGESGGLRPDDGYLVGWRSADDCRALAAAGYNVVAAPAEAYYLDMAVDDGWNTPGMSWAGATSLADVQAFDPAAGWTVSERSRLLGVQACLWTELVPDEPTLWQRLLPRLDAIAHRAWHG